MPPSASSRSTGRGILSTPLGERAASTPNSDLLVDNASGTIGIGFASKLPPDGLNLVIGQADNLAAAPLLIKSVPYDPVSDLQPIAHIADLPIVFLTATEQPYKTLAEVIAAGKADENLLTFASPGVGTTAHLSGELLAQAAAFKMRHVAYKGAAPSLTDVMASRRTGPEPLADLLRTDIRKWDQVVKEARISLE
jgi:tripartite-type tricarboxylate transporter receptor subunit TctC